MTDDWVIKAMRDNVRVMGEKTLSKGVRGGEAGGRQAVMNKNMLK